MVSRAGDRPDKRSTLARHLVDEEIGRHVLIGRWHGGGGRRGGRGGGRWCCGAGGGAREAYPDFSNWTATERIEEAKSTGAEAVVSACPWCFNAIISSSVNFR